MNADKTFCLNKARPVFLPVFLPTPTPFLRLLTLWAERRCHTITQSLGLSLVLPMSRLLIIACSACKTRTPTPVPAIDRYDGPTFRVLRKHLRENPDRWIKVLILSAKFGLIESSQPIPNYDLRIDAGRAETLRTAVLDRFRAAIGSRKFRLLGICLGSDYRGAFDGFEALVPRGTKLTTISGGHGKRLTNLRTWLRVSESCDSVGR